MSKLDMRAFAAAAVVFIFVSGLAAQPAFADTTNPAPKVYVCKYVGKPGVDERVKGGKNPIHVSSNAVKGYNQGNNKFNDAQEQSVVVEDGTDCTPETTTPEAPIPPVTPGKGGGQVLGETTAATTTVAPVNATLTNTGTDTFAVSTIAGSLMAAALYSVLSRKALEACDLD